MIQQRILYRSEPSAAWNECFHYYAPKNNASCILKRSPTTQWRSRFPPLLNPGMKGLLYHVRYQFTAPMTSRGGSYNHDYLGKIKASHALGAVHL